MAKKIVKLTVDEMAKKIETLKEYERLAKEAEEIIDSLKDELKAQMDIRDTDELKVGIYKMHYTDCMRTGLDKEKLAAECPGLVDRYTTITHYKRFSVQ